MNAEQKDLFIKGGLYAGAAVMKRDGAFSDMLLDDITCIILDVIPGSSKGVATAEDKQSESFIQGAVWMLVKLTQQHKSWANLSDEELFRIIVNSKKTAAVLKYILDDA